MTIRDKLLDPSLRLTPSERKLVRVMLGNYPVAGLGTAAALAARARVSDPTVVRFSVKLGYASFTAFQEALLGEVEERLRSPLMMMEVRQARDDAGRISGASYARSLANALLEGTEVTTPAEFDRAVELLATARGRTLLLGGRFSSHLAAIMEAHLRQMRPGTVLLSGSGADLIDRLADITSADLVVIFDYRRYQSDVVSFARQVRERSARMLLFTDRWGSPIVEQANVVLTASVEAPSLFDTMVPALAQIEAVMASLTARLGRSALKRIDMLETFRSANRVTLGARQTDEGDPDDPNAT